MKHPTPAEIRLEISEALFRDQIETADDPFIPPIPVRTLRIVREAISTACDRARGANS